MGRKKKSITQRQLEVLSARVSFEIYQWLESYARSKDLSMTQIMRQAIKEYRLKHDPSHVGKEAA